MRAKSIIAILLISIVAIPALAQDEGPPWDVRPYLSTYTDASFTWNYTATRHRFVCSYCGYSTTVEDQDGGAYECPNPFGLTGHPTVQLSEATPRQRVLGHLDVTAEDIDGDTAEPLVGRPFHPAGTVPPSLNASPSPWESGQVSLADQASWMTLRADNLDGGPGAPLVQNGDGLRFLVVEPGAVRPEASFQYVDSTETITATATIYASAPGGDAATLSGPEDYEIHINPYRVSDGDVYYIRHYEERETWFFGVLGRTAAVECQVYSTLYGNEFDTNGEIDDVFERSAYELQNGCQIVTDSGAVRVTLPRRFDGAIDASNSWVLKIVINSNATVLPTPEEVNYDSVDGNDLYTDANEEEPNLLADITADMSQKKASYVEFDSGNDPAIATADAGHAINYWVEEKRNSDGMISTEIWPYRMPIAAAGRGRALLQWSEITPGATLQSDTPGFAAHWVYYREGAEWHYLADADAHDNRLITNEDVANRDPISDKTDNTAFIDNYFMCSRLDVDHDTTSPYYLSDDIWMNSLLTDHGPVVTDDESDTGGHPRIVLGTEQDPAANPDAWGGEYTPGTRTPSRLFTLANRTPSEILVCAVAAGGCGTRYQLGEPFPDGGDGQLGAGDACPACGATLAEARAEADVHYDAQDSLTASPGGNYYRMASEAFRFGPSSSMVPINAQDYVQEVLAEIPAYQPPSVPAGGTSTYANDIDNDMGYRGTMVAFNRPSDDGDAYDTNSTWDAAYLSPETGEKLATPEAAGDADAQWVCSVCKSPHNRALADCEYCGHTFDIADDDLPTPRVPYDDLTAEEYDPFGMQLSVLREADLAADDRVVDLGWVAPGTPEDGPNTTNLPADVVAGSEAMPTDVSDRSDMPVRNEGNVTTGAMMRAAPMLQTGIDQSVRSTARWAQTSPITLGTLFRYRPGLAAFGDAAIWPLYNAEATGAAGETGTALLQAGIRATAGPYAGTTKPVPLGQPVGNYATEVLLFVDLNGNGTLDFYDAQTQTTTQPYTAFDPGIDEPFEPVAPFATRARVVETRVPQSGFYSPDQTPAMLYDYNEASPEDSNLQVLWVGQRAMPGTPGDDAPAGTGPADVPPPTAPKNILYANAQVNQTAAGDPLYRGWLWAPPGDAPEEAAALSVSSTSSETNGSPTAYVDEQTDQRWAMWHRSQESAAGISSQLRFDASADNEWDGSGTDEFIFGGAGAHTGLTGFVRDGAANAHWLLWHSGPSGREHVRYRWEWDPTSGTVPGDERLMLSNSSTGLNVDFFRVGGQQYRKPALNPFTYVREPSAYGTLTAAGEYELNVLYTGHIRALGNSDICWSRFRFGAPTNPDFPLNTAGDNFGKYPFPRVAGQTYGTAPFPATDARKMPAARDADGDVRGYVGEQLEPSPRRQSFQARDIDWVVRYEYQSTLNGLSGPDWAYWLEAPTPKPGLESYDDPKFYVGVVTDDGTGPTQAVYAVEWSQGSYDDATGVYTVTPRLVQLPTTNGGSLAELDPAARPAIWHPKDDSASADAVYWRNIGGVMAKALLDPRLRDEATDATLWDAGTTENLPAVTLRINPASGLVQWSTYLFNPDNPYDQAAVFNTQNTPDIVDVVMYADYTPFIRRVTTDMADDDSPSASWNAGDSGRLTVFWRRSYGDTDTPHFGRPSFLHRTWTRAIQVGRPAIDSIDTVIDKTVDPTETSTNVAYNLLSDQNGTIQVSPNPSTSNTRIGHRIEVTYADADGISRTEQHRVIGWSLETPVPINAVTSEGPIRVVPEVYEVDLDGAPGSGDEFDTVRYWLAWSSPRGVYDMRPAANDGQRVHQSSDIYLAVVAPEHSSLIADLEVPRLEP